MKTKKPPAPTARTMTLGDLVARELKKKQDDARKNGGQYTGSAAHVLGQMLATWSDWTGSTLLEVCAEALEDANFHADCANIRAMLHEPAAPAKEADDAVKSRLLQAVTALTPAQVRQFVRDLDAVSDYLRENDEGKHFEIWLDEDPGGKPIPGVVPDVWTANLQDWKGYVDGGDAEDADAVNALDDLAYTTDGHVFCNISRLETLLDAVETGERPAYFMIGG